MTHFQHQQLPVRSGPSPMEDAILQQIEWYMGRLNLQRDEYLKSQMDDQMWVSLDVILNFPKMLRMGVTDKSRVATLLHARSTIVEVDTKTCRIRPAWAVRSTLVLECPVGCRLDQVAALFQIPSPHDISASNITPTSHPAGLISIQPASDHIWLAIFDTPSGAADNMHLILGKDINNVPISAEVHVESLRPAEYRPPENPSFVAPPPMVSAPIMSAPMISNPVINSPMPIPMPMPPMHPPPPPDMHMQYPYPPPGYIPPQPYPQNGFAARQIFDRPIPYMVPYPHHQFDHSQIDQNASSDADPNNATNPQPQDAAAAAAAAAAGSMPFAPVHMPVMPQQMDMMMDKPMDPHYTITSNAIAAEQAYNGGNRLGGRNMRQDRARPESMRVGRQGMVDPRGLGRKGKKSNRASARHAHDRDRRDRVDEKDERKNVMEKRQEPNLASMHFPPLPVSDKAPGKKAGPDAEDTAEDEVKPTSPPVKDDVSKDTATVVASAVASAVACAVANASTNADASKPATDTEAEKSAGPAPERSVSPNAEKDSTLASLSSPGRAVAGAKVAFQKQVSVSSALVKNVRVAEAVNSPDATSVDRGSAKAPGRSVSPGTAQSFKAGGPPAVAPNAVSPPQQKKYDAKHATAPAAAAPLSYAAILRSKKPVTPRPPQPTSATKPAENNSKSGSSKTPQPHDGSSTHNGAGNNGGHGKEKSSRRRKGHSNRNSHHHDGKEVSPGRQTNGNRQQHHERSSRGNSNGNNNVPAQSAERKVVNGKDEVKKAVAESTRAHPVWVNKPKSLFQAASPVAEKSLSPKSPVESKRVSSPVSSQGDEKESVIKNVGKEGFLRASSSGPSDVGSALSKEFSDDGSSGVVENGGSQIVTKKEKPAFSKTKSNPGHNHKNGNGKKGEKGNSVSARGAWASGGPKSWPKSVVNGTAEKTTRVSES